MHEPYVKPPLTLFDLSSQHRRFRVATRSEFSQAHGSRLAVPAKGPGSRVCRDDPHPFRQTQIELQVVLEGFWQCHCDGEKEGPMQRSYRMADKSVIWTGERYLLFNRVRQLSVESCGGWQGGIYDVQCTRRLEIVRSR